LCRFVTLELRLLLVRGNAPKDERPINPARNKVI